jgi:hypothetical protein
MTNPSEGNVDPMSRNIGRPSHINKAQSKNGRTDISTDITNEEIQAHWEEVERIVSRRDPVLIQQGFETYIRELPQLLTENREGQMVAYSGNARVAIAPTDRRLRLMLAKGGFNETGKLFITCVTSVDYDEFIVGLDSE